MRMPVILAGGFAMLMSAGSAQANPELFNNLVSNFDARDIQATCPGGEKMGMDLDAEFGPGAGSATRCLQKRDRQKVVIQINQFCRDDVPHAECALERGYALGNIRNMIKDYELHGMQVGRDVEIAVVVVAEGGFLLLKDDAAHANFRGTNQFQSQVEDLLDQGVRFYFCQNTARGLMKKGAMTKGMATMEVITGVEWVTSGISAIPDFESRGYQYYQP